MSQPASNEASTLSDHMGQLSLSSASITSQDPPLSAQVSTKRWERPSDVPTSISIQSPKTPLRRAPSSTSIKGSEPCSSTPTLKTKTSLGSLQGSRGVTPPRSPAIRRTSSYFAGPNGANGRPGLQPPAEEPQRPPLTAAALGQQSLQKDLEENHRESENRDDIQAVVILQDDCYGHRYSRPRTSKAGLNTIVERPERIHASLLGVAAAYVRLGGRHAGGRAPPQPHHSQRSIRPIPFRIHKTLRKVSLRSPAATAIHGVKWMHELSTMCDAAESKLAVGGNELSRPLDPDESKDARSEPKAEFHEGDLYLSSGSLNALEGALGGVCEAVDVVFSANATRRAFVCIRPPGHHCSADMPSGFCWINNVHVGIGHASLTHGLTHAAIIDFDLHHGDGSQAIAWAHNSRLGSLPRNTPFTKKTSIGYFSLHDINSYPCEMGDEEKVRNASLCIENAHRQSIWNVHLQPWKTESQFWALYEDRYLVVLAKARTFLRDHSDWLRQAPTHPTPKAAIFLSAGFDASEWESPHMQRHQVNVPTSFYARFARDVVTLAEEENLGVDGRVISVLEGGYSDRALMSGVMSHLSGLSLPTRSSRPLSNSDEFSLETGRRLGKIRVDTEVNQDLTDAYTSPDTVFDESWWSLPHLEEIENIVNPPAVAATKKQRGDIKPTYTSTTESYKAKIVSSPTARRSFSGSAIGHSQISNESRASSPPPPEVGWAVATYELSKLLIPNYIETRSCRPDELNAEASRARRDRQSGVSLPTQSLPFDNQRMQLREKRTKLPASSKVPETKAPLRTSRRRTMADLKLLSSETDGSSPLSDTVKVDTIKRPARRRSSAASSVTSLTMDIGSELSMASIAESQTEKEPLLIKKARAPPSSHAETVKTKTGKRPSPANRVSSDALIATQARKPNSSGPTLDQSDQASLSVNEGVKNQGVDGLLSDIEKMSIKLKLPLKEENTSKQMKPKAAPRAKPTKSSTAKATKASSPTKSRIKTATPIKSKPTITAIEPNLDLKPVAEISAYTNESNARPAERILDHLVEPEAPRHDYALLAMASSSMAPPGTSSVVNGLSLPLATTPPSKPLEFSRAIADDPTLLPLQSASPAPESANTGTPVAVKQTKPDLPVFTSTTPILFGGEAHRPPTSENIQAADIGGYGKRGAVPVPLAPLSSNSQVTNSAKTAHHDSDMRIGDPLKVDQVQDEQSIWDIPDTPQLKRS